MRKGSAIIRPVTVTVHVGEPIESAGIDLDQRDQLIERVRQRILQMLEAATIGSSDNWQIK
jgi:hypothetical protein